MFSTEQNRTTERYNLNLNLNSDHDKKQGQSIRSSFCVAIQTRYYDDVDVHVDVNVDVNVH